jgi:hypothetical protein
MKRLGELAALLLVLSGCTVSAVGAADDPRPSNSCSNDDDCGSGTNCRESVCQDTSGKLEALLLELTPPTDSSLPHLSLVTHRGEGEVPTTGGDMTFTIPRPARVRGNLRVDRELSDCQPTLPMDEERVVPLGADGSLPLSVSLFPRERLLGLPQQLYLGSTTGSDISFSYEYDLQVPTGAYDVYVVPPRGQTGCVVPPQLLRNQPISEDATLTPLVVVSKLATLENVCDSDDDGLQLPNTLCLHINWPRFGPSPSLDGWVVDMVEPLGGLSVSTEFVLQNPDPGGKTPNIEYRVPLVYSTPAVSTEAEADTEPGTDLMVRLRPGPDTVAPTILMVRAALSLFNPSMGSLPDFTELPKAVEVEGQIVRQDDGRPSSGDVTLVSTEISGLATGILASYQTTAKVGDDGVFRVFLPPGRYRVQAVPPMRDTLGSPEDGLSAIVDVWEIPADPMFQAGKLLQLPPIWVLSGQSAFLGSQIQVQASLQPKPLPESPTESAPVSLFPEAFGTASFAPRASSALVDSSGRFKVQVDPGTFDVLVRVPEELQYAWFVRPAVKVEEPERDIGRVPSPPTTLATGIAQVGTAAMPSPVPFALLRAYAYLDDKGLYTRDLGNAAWVIQVAETRTDEDGKFRLLLPSSIAEPK